MNKSWHGFIGLFIIFIGVMLLLGNVFNFNAWALIWPLAIILLGLWLLFRQKSMGSTIPGQHKYLGDIRRNGKWQVQNEDIYIWVGELTLDMVHANIPKGETKIYVSGFVGDVDVLIPKDVGISVSSSAFVTDAKVLEQRKEAIFSTFNLTSDNYESAERRIRLEVRFFVVDLKVDKV